MRLSFYKTTTIKQKMMVTFLSISLVAVILMTFITQYLFGKTIEKEFFMISEEASARLNHHIEFYFKQIIQSTKTLAMNDLIQSYLLENKEHDYYEKRIIENELKKYVSLNYPEIIGMFLVSRNHDIVSVLGGSASSSEWYQEEPWFVIPFQSEVNIIPTHIIKYPQQKRRPAMSIVIPIYSISSLEIIGNMVIDLSLSEIKNTFQKSNLGGTGIFFIISSDDKVVYHHQSQWLGLFKDQTALKSLNLQYTQRASAQKWMGKKNLIAVSKSNVTEWYIISMVPYKEMAGGLYMARNYTLLALIVIVLIIIVLIPSFLNKYVQPIIKLKYLMQCVAKGDFTVRSEDLLGEDEFYQLNRGFNQMTAQLDKLMAAVTDLKLREIRLKLKQKEAMIRALQNQINPHLLYNSLDVIKSIAYIEGIPVIVTMALNLADIYRYNAKFANNEVTLKNEIDCVLKYLEITHIRYPDNFKSEICINEKFYNCLCIKLILQPIVENAVKYAIESRGGRGSIWISAYDEDQDLIIEIMDDGPGIEELQLQNLKKQVACITSNVHSDGMEQDSLGIPNVHARLVLKYGDGYGLKVDSIPEKATIISLRIPLHF